MSNCLIAALVFRRFNLEPLEQRVVQGVIDWSFLSLFNDDPSDHSIDRALRLSAKLRKHIRCPRVRKYIRDLVSVATGNYSFIPRQYYHDAFVRKGESMQIDTSLLYEILAKQWGLIPTNFRL